MTTAPSADDIPSLAPNPPWAAWNHSQGGLWPWPDDRDIDLNLVDGPPWLDAAGASARRRLQGAPAREVVVGHGDWYTANIRWAGNESHAVHDWDSLISDRESVVAGLAAAVYPGVQPGSEATIEETEEFLDSYARARGRDFSAAELEESWAAGLWIRSFDAKKRFASDGRIGSLTHSEAKERMDRSGI